jgi:hypothetical protein
MLTNVFITGSNPYAALYFAETLKANGINITSEWHKPQPLTRSRDMSDSTKQTLARESIERIKNSDALLIISDPDMVPGGKFVDVGVALGAGKRVILFGARENLKMWHPDIIVATSVADVLKGLGYEEVAASQANAA